MLAEGPTHIRRALGAGPAGDTLTVLVWNLGYAGLGAESDFIADGGRHIFPPSPRAVRTNLAGIVATVKTHPADVYIFPEAARPSPLTFWIDVLGALDATLPDAERLFNADILTRYLPWPIRFEHGLAIYARKYVGGFTIAPLPLEASQIGGLYSRAYSARVARLPVEGKADWAIIGVHLAAFDENGAVRKRQLAEVMRLAGQLHGEGCAVVIGGDFNMTLVETNFPSTTTAENRAWVQTLPKDAIPAGWRVVADPATPSVRTNERPYVAGQNYTAVVDGFIVSPGVEVEAVKTIDRGFVNADHQPVTLRVHRTK